MTPFLGVAVSLPLLGFATLSGIVLIAISVRRLTRNPDQDPVAALRRTRE